MPVNEASITAHGFELSPAILHPQSVASLFDMEGVYTEVGLNIPEGLPYEVWSVSVGTLYRIKNGIEWAIGDALNYGELTYGESYAQMANATGKDRSTLYGYKWIASIFPIHVRRCGVDFSKHEACAVLYKHAPDVAMEILDRALEDGLNIREVRHDVRVAKAELGIMYDEDAMVMPSVTHPTRPRLVLDRERREGTGPTKIEDLAEEAVELDVRVEWLEELLAIVVELGSTDPQHTYGLVGICTKATMWMVAHQVPFQDDKSVL